MTTDLSTKLENYADWLEGLFDYFNLSVERKEILDDIRQAAKALRGESKYKPPEVNNNMINVPLEPFALLMAYCHTSQVDVPNEIRSLLGYPAHRNGKVGHLIRDLHPYVEAAFKELK